MIEERLAYLWLGGLRTPGSLTKHTLIETLGGPSEVMQASEKTLMSLVADDLIKQESFEEICTTRQEDSVCAKAEELEKKGFPFLTPADPDYPELLREIPDPPVTLFYRGHIRLLSETTCLGVVGTRTPSFYGKEVAARFVTPLAAGGVTIVSGLAMGIDTEAHRLAIQAGGSTVGVLGGGIDICYPQRNYSIYREMCENHLVISEYAPGVAPLAIQFPMRNRIISGLSRGLLVLEARKRSGTLITADAALDQGRNVYAIPGRLGDPLSEGTNNLIRQGAMCVQDPEEILEDLGLLKKKRKKRGNKATPADLSEEERKLLAKLSMIPTHVDELLADGDGTLQDTLSLLLSLEHRALIHQPIRGYYTKSQ